MAGSAAVVFLQAGTATAALTLQAAPPSLVLAEATVIEETQAGSAASKPLVVKHKDQAEPTGGLKLTGVSPSPITGSNQPQRIIIKGTGFAEGAKVALSRDGEIEVLSGDQVKFLSSRALAIDVTTGEAAAEWAVMVANPDNRSSNLLGFAISAATAKTANEGKPVTASKKSASGAHAHQATPRKNADSQGLLDQQWLAAQPGEHYTLQLLASSSRVNLTMFVRQYPRLTPLARFVMDTNGTRMHVLTLGSYPDREAAERAAKALPAQFKPWVRSMASVQQVMVTAPNPAVPGGAATGLAIRDTAWVWSQNPSHYTVQLAAAGSERAIEAAMRRTALPGEQVVVQTLRKGEPWYALIYGSFASMDAARGTIERLPAALKQAGPWVRSFASLQGELSRDTP
jgi:septal ring-binding cell division protein DamX